MNPDTGALYPIPEQSQGGRPGDVVEYDVSAEERARLVDKHASRLEAERGLRPTRARREAERLVPPVGASRLVIVSDAVAKTIRAGEKRTAEERRKAKRAQQSASRRRNRR